MTYIMFVMKMEKKIFQINYHSLLSGVQFKNYKLQLDGMSVDVGYHLLLQQ